MGKEKEKQTASPEEGYLEEDLLDEEEFDDEELNDEAETEEEEPENEEEETEEETKKRYAGKYETVEELEKAYKELEKKLGSQERIARKKEIEEIFAALRGIKGPDKQPEQKTEKQDELPDPEEWLENFYKEGPKAVDARIERKLQAMLAEQLAPVYNFMTQMNYERQLQALSAKAEDLGNYLDDMGELISQYPEIARHPNGMELAYRLAKLMRGEAEVTEVKKKAKEEGRREAMEKLGARMPGSKGGMRRSDTSKKSPEDIIRERTFGNMKEKQGLWDI